MFHLSMTNWVVLGTTLTVCGILFAAAAHLIKKIFDDLG